ncbi:unnamed protein product [Arctia plantaginis]|uniref:Uncharacterized protein n=1 Tax=Arctia plantaginis TaxID=874455 RepID=A0A8S0YRD2_ARCPL|nr:unnamed protein product [Arctia plantaginis]
MLLCVYVVLAAIAIWMHCDSVDCVMPEYIKKALREKNRYKTPVRDKTKTFSIETFKEVLTKIKAITMKLNRDAKLHGYKVDYMLKINRKN